MGKAKADFDSLVAGIVRCTLLEILRVVRI